MGEHSHVFQTFANEVRRGDPWWWLSLYTCNACGQAWLVAAEERQNDVFIIKRLQPQIARKITSDHEWPDDFDRYETLLQIGRDSGRRWTFADPLNSSQLHTVIDLAKARPGVGVSELTSLLNVNIATARALAVRAMEMEPIEIELGA